MSKKALVIGVDDYPHAPLQGCVNDAEDVARLLSRNGDGSPNFSVVTLVSTDGTIGSDPMSVSIAELFGGSADVALLYFAGHGVINPETNAGYIVSQDGRRGAWGVSLSEILSLANDAHPRIKSSVIILDCCHSGYAGEVAGLNTPSAAVIGTGVTILTATQREESATEGQRHGIFTEILLDGLSGGCSDIRGNITPAALYSHVDQTLGPWEQRPVYKANVQTFISLRNVEPKISDHVLRRLLVYFPHPAYEYALDPTYEPDRHHVSEDIKRLPVDPRHVEIFGELQKCNRHGLVVPVGAEHMFDVAIKSKACRLTALGVHYRRLVELNRI